eukprot:CAMPEP_0115032284 /NCGR_PEP_ID=MMETSP0216-20121206/39067_1 /TAXON_ID=223996 /ORGANISM="Protocruzia adherens, Strain Boccale" /LENGTH=429 /DNA_ID=CAMNT_0002410155 /DNA_START=228 /DNA_END=1513 /DNA_ORIENTATION=-
MIIDIGYFVVVASLFLGVLTMFFMLSLEKTPSFRDFGSTLVTLLDGMLGSFNLDDFHESELIRGRIYLIIYMLLGAVLILNLLVAILANTYATYSEKAESDYNQVLNEFHRGSKFSSRYGVLRAVPTILNIPTFFLGIFLLSQKQPRKTNEALTCFCYTLFILPVILVIFWFIGLILLPLAYFNCIKRILIHDRRLLPKKQKIKILLYWIPFGLLELLYILFFNDTRTFIKVIYTEHNRRDVKKANIYLFDIMTYEFIVSQLESFNRTGVHFYSEQKFKQEILAKQAESQHIKVQRYKEKSLQTKTTSKFKSFFSSAKSGNWLTRNRRRVPKHIRSGFGRLLVDYLVDRGSKEEKEEFVEHVTHMAKLGKHFSSFQFEKSLSRFLHNFRSMQHDYDSRCDAKIDVVRALSILKSQKLKYDQERDSVSGL